MPDMPLSRSSLGNFSQYDDLEGDPVSCYGAACFVNSVTKSYLYRSKYGYWCIGQ